MLIIFSIPMVPMGKERPRFNGRHAYTPTKTRKWMAEFALLAHKHLVGKVFEGPICVDVIAIFPRPKYMIKRYKSGKCKYPEGFIWHDKPPDRDNADKIVLDSLDKYFNDARVVTGPPSKLYCKIGGCPEVRVRIRTGEDMPTIESILF